MDDRHKKDTQVSHRIINFLRAGYSGEYAFMAAMRELGSPEINDEAVVRLQNTQRRIDGWYEGLGKGDCLFSSTWTAPQTFEAKKALELLESLRAIVERSTGSLRELMSSSDWNDSKEKSRRAAAHIARHAYSVRSYLVGMFELAQLTADKDLSLRLQHMATHGDQNVSKATACLLVLKEHGRIPEELVGEFSRDMRDAVGGLGSQIHDIVLVLAPYKGGDAFIVSSFPPGVVQDWSAVGVQLSEAGYWLAYGISAKVARQWLDSKIYLPGTAAIWIAAGFAPEEASRWISVGLSPDEGKAWQAAGYEFDQAASYIRKGFRLPEQLPKGD